MRKYIIKLVISGLLVASSLSSLLATGPFRIVNSKISVSWLCDSCTYSFLSTPEIYRERWDTLAQTKFWRIIMHTSPDTGYFSVSATREILGKISTRDWNKMKADKKTSFLDSIESTHCCGLEDQVVFTPGKSDFYRISPVLSSIDKAVQLFEQEETDPFYAQAILLIESPGRLQKSTAGAYGSFQLMKAVAQRMGLKVNASLDERKNFEKSAWAAAKLIRTVCLPETRYMLDRNGISYNENDLWFKLLVLHVYHAGAGNVSPVLEKICPSEGNPELIKQIWQTSCGYFRNSSQNYSQLALASLLELNDLILNNCRDFTCKE